MAQLSGVVVEKHIPYGCVGDLPVQMSPLAQGGHMLPHAGTFAGGEQVASVGKGSPVHGVQSA
jgi:hypothetical protein